MSVETKSQKKKRIIRDGGCGRCFKPRRDSLTTAAGTWKPNDNLCGGCRADLVKEGQDA